VIQTGRSRGPSPVQRGLWVLWLALLALTLAVPFVASADPLDDDVRRIAKQLRCPICESVSVADSPAELAGQMRGVIRKKLEAGESDQQILDYFVAAYGDSVLLEPPRRGLGWAIWLGPLVALALGAVILCLVLRVWVRQVRGSVGGFGPATVADAAPPAGQGRNGRASPTSEADRDAHAARARQELDAVRKGLA